VTATIAVPPHGEERGQDKTEDAPHGRINTATRIVTALHAPLCIRATPWSPGWSSLPALVISGPSI
jgi:hypothetical protein